MQPRLSSFAFPNLPSASVIHLPHMLSIVTHLNEHLIRPVSWKCPAQPFSTTTNTVETTWSPSSGALRSVLVSALNHSQVKKYSPSQERTIAKPALHAARPLNRATPPKACRAQLHLAGVLQRTLRSFIVPSFQQGLGDAARRKQPRTTLVLPGAGAAQH